MTNTNRPFDNFRLAISKPDYFFGRQELLANVMRSPFQVRIILGGRRLGKTSTLNAIHKIGKSRSTESFMLHQQRKHDRDFSAWWDEDQRSYGFSQVEQTVYRTLVQQREGTAETVAEQAQFSFGQVADALEVLTGTGVIRQLDDERYTMGSKLFEEWVVRERR